MTVVLSTFLPTSKNSIAYKYMLYYRLHNKNQPRWTYNFIAFRLHAVALVVLSVIDIVVTGVWLAGSIIRVVLFKGDKPVIREFFYSVATLVKSALACIHGQSNGLLSLNLHEQPRVRNWEEIPKEQKEIVYHVMATKAAISNALDSEFRMLCSRESFITPQDVTDIINKRRREMQEKLKTARVSLLQTDLDSISDYYNAKLDDFLSVLKYKTNPHQAVIEKTITLFNSLGFDIINNQEAQNHVNELKPLADVYHQLKGELDTYFPATAEISHIIVTSIPSRAGRRELVVQQEAMRVEREQEERENVQRLEAERRKAERREVARREEEARKQEEEHRRQAKRVLENALVGVEKIKEEAPNPYNRRDEAIMGIGMCAGAIKDEDHPGKLYLVTAMQALLIQAFNFHKISTEEIPAMTSESVLDWYQDLKNKQLIDLKHEDVTRGLNTIAGHNDKPKNNAIDQRTPCEAYMQTLGLVRLLFNKYPQDPNMPPLVFKAFSYIADQGGRCATGARGRAALTFYDALVFLVRGNL